MKKIEQQHSGPFETFKQRYGSSNDTQKIEISPFSLVPKLDFVIGGWYEGISELHGTNDWLLLPRATAGLKILKRFLEIEIISILTTFNTHYISGCVLEAFEGATINRNLQEGVDAIMVIHEWGKPLPNMGQAKKWAEDNDVPLIEDCALTMRKDLGVHGDFVLYSFPKLLPMDHGGLLIGMNDGDLDEGMLHYTLKKDDAQSTGTQYLGHMKHIEENFHARRRNWTHLNNVFKDAGYFPYFELEETDVPYVYMLRTDRSEELSVILKRYGIEAGVYWKNDGLFLPCHQALTKEHLDYISLAVLENIDNCNKNKQ